MSLRTNLLRGASCALVLMALLAPAAARPDAPEPEAPATEAAAAAAETEAIDAEAAPPAAIAARALIETPGAEARLTLETEAPGLVLVSFGADVADRGLEAEIISPLGESLGRNAAFNFIPGTVEIVVRDPRGAFARPEPVSVLIEVRPDADLLEPNSEAHPASVRLNAWYENVLMPSDTDHFAVEVPEAGRLVAEVQGRQGRFDMAFRPAAEGANWSGGGVYDAAPGRHVFRLADRAGRPELEPFRFRIVWTPPQDGAAPDLPLGAAVPALIAQPGFVARYTLQVPEAGLLELSLMGDTPEQTVVQLKQGGQALRGAPLRRHVRPGTYEVEVFSERGRASPRAFHVLANLYRTTDAAEPNDSMDEATQATLDAPLRVILFPENDADWFRFDIPEAGVLTFLVTTSHQNRNAALNTLHVWEPGTAEAPAEGAQKQEEPAPVRMTVPRVANYRSVRLGPFEVKPGPLWLSSTANYRGLPRLDMVVTPEFRPAKAAEQEGDQLFVIGLALPDQVKAEMAAMTGATGGVYVDAENAEVLKARVEEVKRRAEREARRRLGGGGGGWLWLVLLLAAGGGAGWYYRERLRDMARTYGWLFRPELPEKLKRSLHKQ